METTVVKITGMTCNGCVASVKKVLTAIDGVQNVDVSLEQAQATIGYDAARARPAQFRTAIEDAGFEAAA
jgi:copper chaperone